jgi:acyl-CoA synthetase (AMP-forming)/AMP-acid ligase II
LRYASLIDILDSHAADQPAATAFAFLSDSGHAHAKVTFAGLRAHALAIANEFTARGARPGDRAVLIFPPGLDFIGAFFGCLAAGVIAVPLSPPRRVTGRDAVANILNDCAPRFALTTSAYAADLSKAGPASLGALDLEWLYVGDARAAAAEEASRPHRPAPADLAILQYTSGSTSAPKGVMVRHANLLENLEMIRRAMGHSRASTHVCWMPLHHDMGLILNVLEAFYVGATCALMAPVSFLQRPLSWLRAIHEFKAEAAGGPNFGFDLCVARFRPEAMAGVDLSGWRVAFNGAEPVRAQTLQQFAETFAPYGFDPSAFYPCYGMAEATLLISGGRRGGGSAIRQADRAAMNAGRIETPGDEADAFAIVGCGGALAGEQIAIVDPETWTRLSCDRIGEIWVQGGNVAGGYWGNDAASREAFAARIAGEGDADWLRTGDLGFVDAAGEVFVTGRIKDVIIVRGANHYPQDIEHTAQGTAACLRAGFGAAFSVLDPGGQERLVIVQEVERSHRNKLDVDEIAGGIREAVAEEHGLSVSDVVLVRPGSIPKTTSGKIQRRLTRALWLNGDLAAMAAAGNRPGESRQP